MSSVSRAKFFVEPHILVPVIVLPKLPNSLFAVQVNVLRKETADSDCIASLR